MSGRRNSISSSSQRSAQGRSRESQPGPRRAAERSGSPSRPPVSYRAPPSTPERPRSRRSSASPGGELMFQMDDVGSPAAGRAALPSRSPPGASQSRSRRGSISSTRNDLQGLRGAAVGLGNSLSSSSSSGSWQPTASASRPPPGGSRFYASSSEDGSSRSRLQSSAGSGSQKSGASASRGSIDRASEGGDSLFSRHSTTPAIDIEGQPGPSTYRDPTRRKITKPSSQFPGSGYSHEFKSHTEAASGFSYDSWKSESSQKARYNKVKDLEQECKDRVGSYDRGIDNTPEGRRSQGATGTSFASADNPFNKDLTREQHERYGAKAHNIQKKYSETANLRLENVQDYSKRDFKKGLMTEHDSLGGHHKRVPYLEDKEVEYSKMAKAHYDRAGLSSQGDPRAEVTAEQNRRSNRAPRPQPGPEPGVKSFGDRLFRDGKANEEELRNAGHGYQYKYGDYR